MQAHQVKAGESSLVGSRPYARQCTERQGRRGSSRVGCGAWFPFILSLALPSGGVSAVGAISIPLTRLPLQAA